MQKLSAIVLSLFVLIVPAVSFQAQSHNREIKHFTKDGLSFDYPEGFSFEDKSKANGQQLVLTGSENGAQIMVISRFEVINSPEQLARARRELIDTFTDSMVKFFEKEKVDIERSESQIDVAGAQAQGVRLRAVVNNQPGNAEIYSLLLGQRLVLLSFIGSDKELDAAASAWAMIRRTLRVGTTTVTTITTSHPRAVLAAGSLQGSTYTNRYFGLTLTIPRGFQAQDSVMRQTILEKGKGLIGSDDPSKQAQLDESANNTVNLLTLFEDPVSSSYRSSLICAAEKIPLTTTQFTDATYLASLKNVLTHYSKLPYELEKDTYSEDIGGVSFAVVDFKINAPTGQSHQRYYAHIKNGYALAFILSYQSQEQLGALLRIVRAVSLQ